MAMSMAKVTSLVQVTMKGAGHAGQEIGKGVHSPSLNLMMMIDGEREGRRGLLTDEAFYFDKNCTTRRVCEMTANLAIASVRRSTFSDMRNAPAATDRTEVRMPRMSVDFKFRALQLQRRCCSEILASRSCFNTALPRTCGRRVLQRVQAVQQSPTTPPAVAVQDGDLHLHGKGGHDPCLPSTFKFGGGSQAVNELSEQDPTSAQQELRQWPSSSLNLLSDGNSSASSESYSAAVIADVINKVSFRSSHC
ncbi:hypothetical protein CBR_g316 [Chara braunii]|uniref:Uncharacterized protein n=1 Tax=Chara braunii TaxID=69332 RepID=A0A388JQ91_CHABU|nr:hypothetical protein CBR_g316 [Chara braunii]|eukprot:GBG59986.1 hypothetical protein CBR_g316 [Chara braunii]